METSPQPLKPISLRQWGRGSRTLPAKVETAVTCPMPSFVDEQDYRLFIGSRPRQPHYSLPLNLSGFDVVSPAKVVGDRMVVVSNDGHVFFETYWDIGNLNDGRYFRLQQANPLVALLTTEPVTRRIDRAILLGNPMSGNYHHWVINCLPRLRISSTLPELADWPVLVQQPLNAFQRDALSAMGITNVLGFDGGKWEVGELAIPANGVFAPSELRWVREQIINGMGIRRGPPRRIYVSRADASVRRVTNEPEVIECLRRHRIEPMVLSRLSLRDQVQAFVDAEIVIGPHGAGLTNMIFGDEGLKVFELHPADEVNYCFWLTASAMGQKYAFLSGSVANTQRDMTIDTRRLEAIVKAMPAD